MRWFSWLNLCVYLAVPGLSYIKSGSPMRFKYGNHGCTSWLEVLPCVVSSRSIMSVVRMWSCGLLSSDTSSLGGPCQCHSRDCFRSHFIWICVSSEYSSCLDLIINSLQASLCCDLCRTRSRECFSRYEYVFSFYSGVSGAFTYYQRFFLFLIVLVV